MPNRYVVPLLPVHPVFLPAVPTVFEVMNLANSHIFVFGLSKTVEYMQLTDLEHDIDYFMLDIFLNMLSAVAPAFPALRLRTPSVRISDKDKCVSGPCTAFSKKLVW
jgi:hypothetical protein